MRISGSLVLLALLGTPAAADDTSDVLAAIGKGDAAAFRARVKLPLTVSSVWFPDPKCAALSRTDVQVDAGKLPLLVDCLANLGLKKDGSMAMYEPGVRLLLVHEKGMLVSLRGFNSELDKVFVEREVFRAHVTRGLDTLPKPPSDAAFVELRVCGGGAGPGVFDVVVLDQGKDHASYTTAVETAVRGWSVSPFTRGGKPMRVCTIERIEAAEPPPPPPPPGATQNVPPQLLEANRLTGRSDIVPDDDTKIEIQRSGKDRVVGSWKLCLTDQGAPSEVRLLKGTGFAAYDAKIDAAMRTWRYRPYLVNGKAAPVCTAITYIYSQK